MQGAIGKVSNNTDVEEELRKMCGKGRKMKRHCNIFQSNSIWPVIIVMIGRIQNSHYFLGEIRKTMQGAIGDLLNYK